MRPDEVEGVWYGSAAPPWHWRVGSRLFQLLSGVRRALYHYRLLPRHEAGCPVVVVGNITVGGTGKTPLVAWLASQLQAEGWRPGIVSRGYGGRRGSGGVMMVQSDTDSREAGDEPVLLARRTGLPVAVHRHRYLAARHLVDTLGVSVVIADDGLQHYALARDIEICVLDGERRLGNGRLLPAGPLREPAARLESFDYVVANGRAGAGEVVMRLEPGELRHLRTGELRPLPRMAPGPVHAVAGIGHPERFFGTLEDAGLRVHRHPFPDHHAFTGYDLAFGDSLPIIMTEKDAVRLDRDPPDNAWCLPVYARLPGDFAGDLLRTLAALRVTV